MLVNNDEILRFLDLDFADRVKETINACASRGVEMVLIDGLRNPFKQAIYWRQSRGLIEIEENINNLRNANLDFLAYCIFVVGKQGGRHVTNALPGLSWHQYGMAIDCGWQINSKICWDDKILINGLNGYQILAQEAAKLNINSGYNWSNFRDSCHLQADFSKSPLSVYKWKEINHQMEIRFASMLKDIKK